MHDFKVDNPLLTKWRNNDGYKLSYPRGVGSVESVFSIRREAVVQYSWAIPSDAALSAIANEGPIVEIGAGLGYWAALLDARGVDIVAYDLHPNPMKNGFHRIANSEGDTEVVGIPWFDTKYGGTPRAAEHADRALFLCWPPYNTRMAYESLRKYLNAGGHTLIYVGEGMYGCTGDDTFHRLMRDRMTVVKSVSLPQWYGIHDGLEILKTTQ